jgi:hypothetical protein
MAMKLHLYLVPNISPNQPLAHQEAVAHQKAVAHQEALAHQEAIAHEENGFSPSNRVIFQ